MPSPPLLDLSGVDLNRLIITREQIYERLPHRYEFMQLDGIVYVDPINKIAVGLRDVGPDEFWVRGHIPGRPLFPGVLMLESAAQMASYLTAVFTDECRFMGFGGVDKVKFRDTVVPPAKLYIIEKLLEARSRRVVAAAQGFVNGKMVFEGEITGMPV